MSPSNITLMPGLLTLSLCCAGAAAIASHAAVAADQSAQDQPALTQIGRYSVVAAGHTSGQRDLLSVAAAIAIPAHIESVGDALRWILQDSGYRLAADPVLTEQVRAMLELPLPAVHRRFEPMALTSVMALIVGPAFQLVQDPFHRLIGFERCAGLPEHSSTGALL